MAELSVFGYSAGTGLIHRLDARFKLLFLILISLAGLSVHWIGLLILCLPALAATWLARPPILKYLSELRPFFLLLGLVLLARALTTPGNPAARIWGLTFTWEGLSWGGLIATRLFIVAWLSLIMVRTTKSSEIRTGVAWFLKPVPFIPEQRAATMMGLTIRFIPLIMDQIKETQEAQRARGVENRKNPYYRLKALTLPLFRRTFLGADRLALAMEARCYRDDRTQVQKTSTPADWAALALVGTTALLAAVFF